MHAMVAPAEPAAADSPASDAAPAKKRAKTKGSKSPKRAKAASDAKGENTADGRKISLEEDFLVEGKREKPNAFYILQRSQAGYDWARLDAKFLPLVLESVQDPLF